MTLFCFILNLYCFQLLFRVAYYIFIVVKLMKQLPTRLSFRDHEETHGKIELKLCMVLKLIPNESENTVYEAIDG